MLKPSFLWSVLFVCGLCTQCKQERAIQNTPASIVVDSTSVATPIKVHPIRHASLLLQGTKHTLYIDPTGAYEHYKTHSNPDLILITDLHSDHMDIETLDSLPIHDKIIIAPTAVAERLPASYTDKLILLTNGEQFTFDGITIEAIPMYNLREDALHFHPKGRGNGYLITMDDTRIYISGDTEGIPEMRNLKDIDMAFVCMNLPYTMSATQAATAVLDFKPSYVYPYHYKGKDGFSDIAGFNDQIQAKNPTIQVIQLEWYPNEISIQEH